MRLLVSKLAQLKYVTQTLISRWKYENLATVVRVCQNMQNVVISRCCFAEDGKKCTKIYNARAQTLFCSLNLLFGGILVAAVIR